MRAIAESLGSQPGHAENGSTGRYLALVNYNINPISSAMFITATAPNPLIVSFLTKGTDGVLNMTWGMWAIAALLPALVSLVVMPIVICGSIRQLSRARQMRRSLRGKNWMRWVHFLWQRKSPWGVHFAALSMGGCSSNADGQCLERKPH
jgi:di/tricarboxylate transporter